MQKHSNAKRGGGAGLSSSKGAGNEPGTPYERARRWLELLAECTTRLKTVESKLTELDMIADDMRGQHFDAPHVSGYTEKDRLGALIVSRMERREELREERELLTVATANARRLVLEVARASNDATVAKGAAFVLARHIHGMKAKDAGQLLGYTHGMAQYYQAKFTQALVDNAADKFTGERLPYGWYEFARGETRSHGEEGQEGA